MQPEKFRPLKDDVLLKNRQQSKVAGSIIEYKDDTNNDENQYFEVLRVGPDAKYVKEGDIVLASWKRITPPFELGFYGDKQKYGVTSEKEIMAIIEV